MTFVLHLNLYDIATDQLHKEITEILSCMPLRITLAITTDNHFFINKIFKNLLPLPGPQLINYRY